ncbi:MAG TPA: DNA polymerase III subunit alpha [Elusimicrobiota bacterium]|nr:DNA polymerase III subunit alpha [Elusimicrobiota bacterium]
MSHAPFVHLHNHTEYSLLDGACRLTDDKGNPSELLKSMANAKYRALAITDHGNMFGALEFYQACTDSGIKPILGVEAYMAPGSRLDRTGSPGDVSYHLTLLAENETGYQNLLKLTSKAYLEGFYYKPRIDKEILAAHSEGVIGLSGCLKGEIPSALLSNQPEKAQKLLDDYRSIFAKDHFYLELMDHGMPEQKAVIPLLTDLSKRSGIPLVATNDCHYLRREDSFPHDVLLCIGTGKTLNDEKRLKYPTAEFYYKSPQEMMALFGEIPGAIENTVSIAEMCHLQLKFNQILLPRYDVPSGETPDSYLEKLCLEGLKKRMGHIDPQYKTRLDYEIQIIRKMGFSTYFLIVWDFIHHARKEGIPVGPGRGSGAGSLVAYALHITSINPIEHGLLFERFLNPDRRSMPDLDIDFSDDLRENVIRYVRQKYGEQCVAQIITFGSMLARLVVRDVGRVLGMPIEEVDRIARLIPKELGTTIHSALQSSPEFREAAQKDPQAKKLIDLAQKLEGIKRQCGVHAAGTVITSGDITQYVPLYKGSRDVVTTQYDGETLLKLGLLKVDFLGLRTLSVIRDACKLIVQRHDPKFNIDTIPLDDLKTYQLLGSAKTLGVFQLESGGMRDLLCKLKPSTLSDVVALISLYRPGPMGSGMLDEFVARKHARSKVHYDHPSLEPLLKDTYGIIVYQEQVMQIAQVLAGFTPGKADILRKAMGKKIPEVLEQQRSVFMEGAHQKNIDKKTAQKVFEQIVHFGGYGFNKSHATAYGLVSYQTAYLKANFPEEYMAALMTSEIGHSNLGAKEAESKLVWYINESENMGIQILPPDVNLSGTVFTIESAPKAENPKIRFGLLAVKNVGEGPVEAILKTRSEHGLAKSFDDFCLRMERGQINKKVVESLVKAGAMDCFCSPSSPEPVGNPAVEQELRVTRLCRDRAVLFAKIDNTLARLSKQKEDEERGQGALFDMAPMTSAAPAPPDSAEAALDTEWPEHTLLAYEKEVLGIFVSGHPLARYRKELSSYTTHNLGKLPESGSARVAGMIMNTKKTLTKTGKAMARFKLEDLEGEVECIVLPKTYTPDVAQHIVSHEMIVVKGRVESKGTVKEILVDELVPLKAAREKLVRRVWLKISTTGLKDDTLAKLDKICADHQGKCSLVFQVQTPTHGQFALLTQKHVQPSEGFLQQVERLMGKDCWELRV